MRSRALLGLLVGMGALLALSAGCGDDGGGDGAGGGGSGQGTTTTTTTTTGTTTTSTTGTGGGTTTTTTTVTTTSTETGDDNNSFEEAEELTVGEPVQGALEDPTADEDYFKFEGKKGQAILVSTDAKPQENEFDPEYPDVVVTLYDAEKAQIAQNDDPFPRYSNDSELLTILPADGTYYVRMTECGVVFGADSCAPAENIVNTEYAIGVFEIDPALNGVIEGEEPNDDPEKATEVEYEPGQNPGTYQVSLLYGTFSSDKDVDVYKFNMPETDITFGCQNASGPCETRSVANFSFYPSGAEGNGSTSSVGKVRVVDAAAPEIVIAEADVELGADIGVPLEFAKDYLVFVPHPEGAAGANDFYFSNHNGGGSNPVELNEAENDTLAGAEEGVLVDNLDGSYSYFFEGDIVAAPGDVDHFALEVPGDLAPDSTITMVCGAQGSGSGLRGLKTTLLSEDGDPLPKATLTEKLGEDPFVTDIEVPAGAKKLVFKAEAGSQDPTVTSTFYRCGLHFQPPAP